MDNGLLLWLFAVGGGALLGGSLVLIRVGSVKRGSDAMLAHYSELLDEARRKRPPEEPYIATTAVEADDV